jgi:hypothetical protein
MTAHSRPATLLAGLTLLLVAPAAAQDVATVYLKEGGTIRGQVVDDSDPNGIKVRSEKSGTTFMLKRTWVDSVVRSGMASATPAPAAPAVRPAVATPSAVAVAAPAAVQPVPVSKPVAAEPKPVPVAPTPATTPKPVAQQAPAAPAPAEATPVAVASPAAARSAAVPESQSADVQLDGLEPPKNVPNKQVKAQKSEASPVRSPSRWYIGGGGSAYTGSAASATDIGYTGMVGYGTGLGGAMAVRLGGSGSYWRLGSGAGDFYDVAGNLDLIVGPRGPRFVAPYAVLGGMGGVRSISPVQVGATGYTRDPLYGARVGGGFTAKRVFLEASYQHVWVDGVSSGYVPFVFGFRF